MSQGFTKAITLDTDGTLAADSDMLVASQKAVKTYVDNAVGGAGTVQSVTGLDTDNTDPANPVVQIAIGAGLSGDGTPGTPLVGNLGDVVGPASAVDDRIATFDGTTGKLIQDGGYTVAQILALPKIYPLGQTTTLITHTGTVAETKVWSLRIPANTIGNNDTIEVQCMSRRTTGAGGLTMLVYLNNTDDLVTPTEISRNATAASQTMYSRNFQKWLNVANSSVGVFATGIGSVTAGLPYTTTYANTSDIYVVVSLTLVTGTDTATLYNVQVNHIKN